MTPNIAHDLKSSTRLIAQSLFQLDRRFESVTANLANAAANTGDAAGDTYTSIENLTGSAFADTLTGRHVSRSKSTRLFRGATHPVARHAAVAHW